MRPASPRRKPTRSSRRIRSPAMDSRPSIRSSNQTMTTSKGKTISNNRGMRNRRRIRRSPLMGSRRRIPSSRINNNPIRSNPINRNPIRSNPINSNRIHNRLTGHNTTASNNPTRHSPHTSNSRRIPASPRISKRPINRLPPTTKTKAPTTHTQPLPTLSRVTRRNTA
jgi:hypothetical protein